MSTIYKYGPGSGQCCCCCFDDPATQPATLSISFASDGSMFGGLTFTCPLIDSSFGGHWQTGGSSCDGLNACFDEFSGAEGCYDYTIDISCDDTNGWLVSASLQSGLSGVAWTSDCAAGYVSGAAGYANLVSCSPLLIDCLLPFCRPLIDPAPWVDCSGDTTCTVTL